MVALWHGMGGKPCVAQNSMDLEIDGVAFIMRKASGKFVPPLSLPMVVKSKESLIRYRILLPRSNELNSQVGVGGNKV